MLRTEGLQEEPLDDQHAFVVDAMEAIRDDCAHRQGNDKRQDLGVFLALQRTGGV